VTLKLVARARTRLGSRSVSWWSRRPVAYLDPREVLWARTPVNRAAVEYYKRHPDGRYKWWDHDGDPCVVRAADGTLEGRNGKHRALAAIETGRRRLKVRLHDESRSR
jgi:hypothetical protein